MWQRATRLHRQLKTLLAALATLSVTWLSACSRNSPPPRPSAVPATAVWAGGVDGGAWIDCSVDSLRNVNPCTVYHEKTGEIWAKGAYLLRDAQRAATREELTFEAFDGDVIHLRNGKVLTRTKAGD